MQELSQWSEIAISSLKAMGIKVMTAIPSIIGAILLILIGWLIARLISWIVFKAIKAAKISKWTDKLNSSEVVNNSSVTINPERIISKFVYWVIMLIFLITASETLGWDTVSKEIGGLVSYLPRLFSALIILAIGLYIASFIKKALHTTFSSLGISGASIISSVVYYIIVVILTVTALNQAGIDTTIITNNISIILGSVLFSFALAFGLGSKELLQNMLSSLYSKRSIEIGDKVKIGEDEGTVLAINNINITLSTKRGKTLIPSQYFMKQKVEIIND